MSLGPIMVDLKGCELLQEERKMLRHPLVGGVILFSRNYQGLEQLQAIIREIHEIRSPRLLVAVDHEGGVVQRFRDGFTRLPACAKAGQLYDLEQRRGLALAEDCGWMMASELRAVGVDFSFAPVLDIGAGISQVINDRAFHHDPEVVFRLARAFMRGMQAAGMAAVGKHFPGHGSVEADSHHEIPMDDRRLVDIEMQDMIPFERMVNAGLAAIMPAHVIYPQVDPQPAGFSAFWLQEILRRRLGFQGVIFSDDISMAGATVAGTPLQRTEAAIRAGCDMVLVCNDPEAAREVLKGLKEFDQPMLQARLMRMHGRHDISLQALQQSERWQQVAAQLKELDANPELAFGDDGLI